MAITGFRFARAAATLAAALALIGSPLVGAGAGSPASAAPTIGDGDLNFTIERIDGADRYATAAHASRDFFSPGVPVVYLASGVSFPDALAAGPTAQERGGPVLFTRENTLPIPTATELARLRPERIVIVGGTSVISEAVRAQAAGYATQGITRVAGPNRYGTSVALSQHAFPAGANLAYVATGTSWPDALAGGAAAAVQDAPMLLTRPDLLPQAVRQELERLAPDRIMLLGGTSAVSGAVASQLAQIATTERIAGPSRYDTALAVSQRVFGPSRPGVVIATGGNYPDALAAAPLTGTTRGPILLVRPNSLPSGTGGELDRLTPRTAYLMGGTQSMSVEIAKQVQRERGVCWSGPTYSGGSQQILSTVRGTTSPKMAFTLDMGGRLEGAMDIVDFLIENQVCTTFFPTSLSAETTEGAAIIAKIAQYPHLFEVGNHTVHHCDLVNGGGGSPSGAPCQRAMTAEFIRAELQDAEDVLAELTGMQITPMWRPPYGAHNQFVRNQAAAVGYPVTVMWARDTIDWDPNTTTAQIVARTTSPLPPSGAIVLAHLGGYRTGAALPQIVQILRANGYTMTTVSDLRDG